MAHVNRGEPKTHADVIIVGAGPVGLLTALRLGQAGVDTLVIEGHHTLLNTTRAVVYMPMVIPVLRELGILDKVKQNAYLNTEGVTWRDIDGTPLANLPLSSASDDGDGVLMLGQWRMSALVLEELAKCPSVQVRFGLKLMALEDGLASVSLVVGNPKDPDGTKTQLTASYVLGADGANSTTRQLLGIPFEGTTYDFRLVGIDVVYDFIGKQNFSPLNFIVHPTDWAVITYTGQNESGQPASPTLTPRPQWRIAYPESANLPSDRESVWSRASAQITKYVASPPAREHKEDEPEQEWTLLRAEPYKISQRRAKSPVSVSGRIALAGDALHSNNPIGGLGLTGGILDAFCFGDALVRTIQQLPQTEGLLVKCAHARLKTWLTTTDGLSRANIERLYAVEQSESGRNREVFFRGLNSEDNTVREMWARRVRVGMEGMVGGDM